MQIELFQGKNNELRIYIRGNLAGNLPNSLRYREYSGANHIISLNNHLKYKAAHGLNGLFASLSDILKEIKETHERSSPSH